jgi:subtilisin family serine protease
MGSRGRRGAAALGLVLAAMTAGPARAQTAPDPDQPMQWALATIGAPQAWSRSRGAGITIAVLDSGVDALHQDLAANVRPGIACLGTGGDPARCAGPAADDDGHGTHVAGIAAAVQGNGVGIAGVAPSAAILPVRVLQHTCRPQADSGTLCDATGATDDLRAGIHWAVDHGAEIVNLSIGPDLTSVVLHALPIGDAVDYAWAHGVIVVVAAGNNFNTLIGTNYDHLPLVVVSATDRQDHLAPYSNGVGTVRWGIAAPGGAGPGGGCPSADVLSTYAQAGRHDAYACMWGTSMAAPHVSGTLALLRGAGLGPLEAVNRLLATADPLGGTVPNAVFGFGRVDAARALSGLTRPTGAAAATRVAAGPAPMAASQPVEGGGERAATPAAGAPPGAPAPGEAAGTPRATGRPGAPSWGRASRPRSPRLRAARADLWPWPMVAALALAASTGGTMDTILRKRPPPKSE